MTAVDLLALRPRRRDDLRIGPSVLRGTTEVHPVLDPVGGGRYELRAKEHFVLSQLDGERTLAEVGERYAARFGVRLGERNWQQLLGLLYGRALLVSEHRPPPQPAKADPETPAAKPSNILGGRTRMVADADALVEKLHRHTAFVRGRAFLTAVLVLTAGMLVDLGFRWHTLTHDLNELSQRPVLLMAVGVVVWLSLGLHELAHGLVGRAYGGTVTEIGLRWQLPVTYLYCLVRDIAFFARRRHQMATAVAGPLMNLVFVLPFWPVWLLLSRNRPEHYALGGVILLGVATAVGNMIPLPPLDGYKLLGYGLGTSRLATDSRLFLRLAVAGMFGRGEGIGAYTRRMRLVYGIYGALSTLVLAGIAAAVLAWAGLWLADRYGAAAGCSPVAVVALALVLWRMGIAARAKREADARRRAAA